MRPTVGFALCGSFCTFRKAIDALRALTAQYTVVPIFSDAAWETDTRFGASADFRAEVTALCGTEPLHTLAQVEPLGPKHLLDLLIVAPCTGNTLGKLANGIADSPVSFACKAHLRNGRPVLLAVSTNDGLSGSAAAGPPSFLLRPLRAGQPDRQARQPCGTFFPAAGGGRGSAAG